ncbi:MAG: M1 family aminopeptidase [Flavipsychrobacter sp.]
MYRVIIPFLLMMIAISTHAQESYLGCTHKYKEVRSGQKTTVADLDEDKYDIKHLFFKLELGNTSTSIKGDVTTTATTVVAGFNVYAFELDAQLTIDSVKFNGQKVTVTTNGAVRKVNLATPLSNNTSFTVQVFYHGQPTSGTGQFFTGGLNKVQRPSGTNILYTLSDPDRTDEWWPCKQSLKDKIDSVDMWVTTADSLKAGSNGLLLNTTSLPGNKLRYEWKTKYPIDYYLITLAVAPYGDYSYYMHYTDGSNDSMLIQNYLYDSATFMTPAIKAALDTTGILIDHFSELYGKYPFYKEKYGHCVVGELGGGMEHQTMTTLGPVNTGLIAHEMGHQWWGNNVTYGTWKDIWLSEGLATYTAQLFFEKYWGVQAAKTERTSAFGTVMTQTFGSVYVDDTTSVNRIFSGRLTYAKGAAVAHMLRYLAPEDSLFFKGLRNFQQQYAYKNAVTDDLKQVFEQVYNQQLDTFFRQWVYGEGFPIYSIKYYQVGNTVHLQINQSTSFPNSVAVFHLPVELQLNATNGDTTVKLMNTGLSQNYSVTWDKTVTGISIDPNEHIVNRNSLVSKDQTILSIATLNLDGIKVYPNPAKEVWHIEGVATDTWMYLYDVTGKLVWSGVGAKSIPAKEMPSGNYLLQIENVKTGSQYFKLVK